MCGIADFYGTKKIDIESISSTLVLMKNRGPDFSSYVTKDLGNNKFVSLLHSRLSIIDLQERSNQPFSIDDYTIIYNGEIFNAPYLRLKLEKKGGVYSGAGI